MWRKTVRVILIVVILLISAACSQQEPKVCCLCGSFRYHAPCLIDLQTGNMIELDLYFPHETKVAELAEEQPERETFSFISLGNASGYRDTCYDYIEINIPAADIEKKPALCEDCRKLLQAGYTGRYVLADLYEKDTKELIPIAKHIAMELRCYTITVTEEDTGNLKVVIQGNLA